MNKTHMRPRAPLASGALIRVCAFLLAAFAGHPLAAQDDETIGRFRLSVAPALDIALPDLKPPQGHDDPVLAYNLNSVADWSTQMPFIDVMKTIRQWIGALPGEWDGWTEDDLRAGGYLDENGWITAIPPELELIRGIFAWRGNAYGEGDERAGTYELTYEGTGNLEMLFVDVISQDPNRIVFEVTNDADNWGFVITETDPQRSGDYIRDISIVNRRHLALYQAGAVFNPDWIQHVRDARMLRFATWQNASNSRMTSWSEMPSVDHYRWATVPIDIEVQLANQIGADPWFSLPFLADDDFARQMAAYVKDHLDPGLVAHVELSNEVWNGMFDDAQLSEQAAAEMWNLARDDVYTGAASYYGKRAADIMNIWTEVFGDETDTRLMRIAGTQTVNTWLSEQILEAPMWQQNDRAGYAPPHLSFDALSPTLYFGGEALSGEKERAALLAAIQDPAVDSLDFHYRLLKGDIPGFEGGLPLAIAELHDQDAVARKFDLRLVPYEGGQHVHHSAFVDIPEADLLALQDHMVAFVRSDQMAQLYRELWEAWAGFGSGPFMQYTDVGGADRYGSWGLRASNRDNPPRALLLDRLNAESKAWWEDRGGAHFQQGVIETGTRGPDLLSGTVAEDTLVGLDGDDTFYPGGGDDGVNGGAGTDRVLFAGPRQDFAITADGERLIVSGPDGRDRLFDVEELVFSDLVLTVSTSATGQN